MKIAKLLLAVMLVFAATAEAKKINTTYNDEARFWDGLVVGTTTARSASYVVDVVGNSRFTGTLTATTLSGAMSSTTGAFTGAVDVDGQFTTGADATKSTVTTGGAASFYASMTAPAVTASTSLTVPGYVAITSATAVATISTSTVIPHTSSFVVVVSSGGVVVSEANPQITAGVSGQILTIRGSSDTNTVGLVDSNGLALTAAATLGNNDTLTLIYDTVAALWVEIARADN